MTISDTTPSALIPLSLIQIDRDARQRREIITDDLEFSITNRGLMHPIVVRDNGDGTYKLIAGERRYTSYERLGRDAIPCRFATELSPLELELLELEENIKRKDLTWQECVSAVEKAHTLYLAVDADWTRAQTAEAIGLSEGTISLYMTVSEEAKTRPELLERKTVREAFNVVKRSDQRKMGNALEEMFATVKEILRPDEAEILDNTHAAEAAARTALIERDDVLGDSFLDWAPSYTGEKFNLIHCDFPYGVGLFDKEFGNRGGARPYEDTAGTYFSLLNCLVDNLDRIMSLSGHLVFWYSAKYDRETKDLFAAKAPTLEFTTHPFIWNKSDNQGIIGDARRDLRHTYETALIARRSGRQVVKSVADIYSAPTDRTLHPSAKPEPVLKHLFSALVDEHTRLLDPTCGGGSALRAAEAMGASSVLGLEIDPEYADAARSALRMARKLRLAAATTRT